MNKQLQREIKQSGMLHRPLPLHEEHSFEHLLKMKKVLKSVSLGQVYPAQKWIHIGRGEGCQRCSDDDIVLHMSSPSVMNTWPEGASADGDYSAFGEVKMELELPNANWENFQHLRFDILSDCDGIHSPRISFAVCNNGTYKLPDRYNREGYHVINLKNRSWNECILDISTLPKDCITKIAFFYSIDGRDRSTGKQMAFSIKNIRLECVEDPEIDEGWLPKKGDVVYSHIGYSSEASKIAIANDLACDSFSLWEGANCVLEKHTTTIHKPMGSFQLLDFSEYTKVGTYTLHLDQWCSKPFTIDQGMALWDESIWKTLNFIYCERCGCPIHDKHGSCHGDVIAHHKDVLLSFQGGWHDAGDVSQQMLHSAEVTYALLEIALKVKEQDETLYLRLMEEAQWGLDFILKCRFQDGYRATSAGLTRWSDGLINNMDDVQVRVHNQAYENFVCAGIEAFASTCVDDDMLKERLHEVAIEDFDFALEQYEKVGFDEKPIFWEHSYMTSESLYMASASWSASQLFQITGDLKYANKASEYYAYCDQCQRKTPLSEHCTIQGFFYRNTKHRVIQHFNHQSRDHMYMMALQALILTQPKNDEVVNWYESARLYREYMIALQTYASPYGMMPSGIYHIDEASDEKSFHLQHLLSGDEAIEDYQKQLQAGIQLDEHHYLRQFPVWFSFRGNSAILLASGKAAAICAHILQDEQLLDIAQKQLHWIQGNNPFAQSLMYGSGYNYAQQYAGLAGEMCGEIAVGIETRNQADIPYWPQMNNATYKEIWIVNAGKWLSLVSEFI